MERPGAARAASLRVAWWRAPWAAPGGLVLLLTLLTVSVLAGGPLMAADRAIRNAVQAQATSAGWRWLSAGRLAPAQLITDLGSARIAGVVLSATAIAMAVRRRSVRPLVIAAAGGGLLAATVIPAKILIARPGPGYATLPAGGWGEFPSGHASTAGVCYGLAVLLLTVLPGTVNAPGAVNMPEAGKLRKAASAVAVAVSFLVGVALVWCDYHWFTDVVAGWALAALIIWVVWQAQRRVTSWPSRKPGRTEPVGTQQGSTQQVSTQHGSKELGRAEEHTR
jgi:membrane-associated phospholipid phosphatase